MGIIPLFIYYVIIPFCVSLIITLLTLQTYGKISSKKKSKHRDLELKIYEMEKQLRQQRQETDLLSDIIASAANHTNSKLDNIQSLIKTLDEIILSKNTSQYHATSPQQSHVSNSIYQQSQARHDMPSHSQIGKEGIDNDKRQNSTIEYILKKLENNSLTTREIQQIIGRTREHTSRLMKKLFDGKFVDRNMDTKPFRYTITDEGRKLLIKHSASNSNPHSDYPENSENLKPGSTGIQYPVNSNL
jgi:hypothetical protein